MMRPNGEIWMIYGSIADMSLNSGFIRLMQSAAEKRGLFLRAVVTDQLTYGMNSLGQPFCRLSGVGTVPDAVVSRQRDARLSRLLEAMGIPVFNGSRVCEICNHKQETHLFLHGLPMADTVFVSTESEGYLPMMPPVVVKPCRGHGGVNVTLCHNETDYHRTLSLIAPDDAVVQRVVSGAGRDLRLYVLFGEIVAGVMRTAREGIVSNFKLGGDVQAHSPTPEERNLGERVIRRFAEQGAPLAFAGVDLLFEKDGTPVVGEVEDVVGSRMLYTVSDLDIADLYMERLAQRL